MTTPALDPMPFGDHVAELRVRLFRALLAIGLAWGLAFVFHRSLLAWLLMPAGDIPFIATAPAETFLATLRVTLHAALILAYPMVAREVARFVGPGLLPAERRALVPLLVGAAVLFTVGALFAYSVLLPAGIHFLRAFGPDSIHPMWSVGTYLAFASGICFVTGVVFQLPLVLVAAALARLVTVEQLMSVRRVAWMGGLAIGAIASPSADLFSQTILGCALVGLYEFSILVIRFVTR